MISVRFTSDISIQEVRTDSGGVAIGDRNVLLGWRHERVESLSASRDGKRLAFLSRNTVNHVYTTWFDPAVGLTGTPTRLTPADWNELVTAWTPDSDSVLFSSNRHDDGDIFRQRLGSVVAEPLVTGPGEQFHPEVTSDGRWVLYTDHSPDNDYRIMRIPLTGGTSEPLVAVHAWGIPRCSFRGGCVVEKWQGSDLVISALDPMRGEGAELGRLQTSLFGFCIAPDGDSAAFIVPSQTDRRNRLRLVSFTGRPPKEILVRDVTNLWNLDPLSSGAGFFSSMSYPSGRGALVFIRPDGASRVLWSPENLDPFYATASPDSRHLAIGAAEVHSNAWMMTRF